MSQLGGGIQIGAQMRSFFDRPKVLAVLGRQKTAVLSRGGAMIRGEAQKSLKYEDAPSAPGTPPHAHRTIKITKKDKKTGQARVTKSGAIRKYAVSPLREFLFFEFDFGTESMVVGPKRLRGKIGDAPRALEHGGMTQVMTRRRKKNAAPKRAGRPAKPRTPEQLAAIARKYAASGKGGQQPNLELRTVRMPPRPYMRPAGLRVLPKITPLWGTLRR